MKKFFKKIFGIKSNKKTEGPELIPFIPFQCFVYLIFRGKCVSRRPDGIEVHGDKVSPILKIVFNLTEDENALLQKTDAENKTEAADLLQQVKVKVQNQELVNNYPIQLDLGNNLETHQDLENKLKNRTEGQALK